MLKRLFAMLAGSDHPTMISDGVRSKAFDTLRKHGIGAHFYLPAAGCEDRELADALRFLGDRGYIMTNGSGAIVGKVAKANLTSEERAQHARQGFFLVER